MTVLSLEQAVPQLHEALLAIAKLETDRIQTRRSERASRDRQTAMAAPSPHVILKKTSHAYAKYWREWFPSDPYLDRFQPINASELQVLKSELLGLLSHNADHGQLLQEVDRAAADYWGTIRAVAAAPLDTTRRALNGVERIVGDRSMSISALTDYGLLGAFLNDELYTLGLFGSRPSDGLALVRWLHVLLQQAQCGNARGPTPFDEVPRDTLIECSGLVATFGAYLAHQIGDNSEKTRFKRVLLMASKAAPLHKQFYNLRLLGHHGYENPKAAAYVEAYKVAQSSSATHPGYLNSGGSYEINVATHARAAGYRLQDRLPQLEGKTVDWFHQTGIDKDTTSDFSPYGKLGYAAAHAKDGNFDKAFALIAEVKSRERTIEGLPRIVDLRVNSLLAGVYERLFKVSGAPGDLYARDDYMQRVNATRAASGLRRHITFDL